MWGLSTIRPIIPSLHSNINVTKELTLIVVRSLNRILCMLDIHQHHEHILQSDISTHGSFTHKILLESVTFLFYIMLKQGEGASNPDFNTTLAH